MRDSSRSVTRRRFRAASSISPRSSVGTATLRTQQSLEAGHELLDQGRLIEVGGHKDRLFQKAGLVQEFLEVVAGVQHLGQQRHGKRLAHARRQLDAASGLSAREAVE